MRSKQAEVGREERPARAKKQKTVPKHLLDQIAGEILNRSKELGLFDEMRMKLLEKIQSSKEFNRVESGFKRELDSLCSRLDLSLPRSKLREKLNTRNLPKSASRLDEHVLQVSRQQRHELRKLYNEHALPFLKTLTTRKPTEQQSQPKAEAEVRDDQAEEPAQASSNVELRLEVAPLSAGSTSADSGFGSQSSISPPAITMLPKAAPDLSRTCPTNKSSPERAFKVTNSRKRRLGRKQKKKLRRKRMRAQRCL